MASDGQAQGGEGCQGFCIKHKYIYTVRETETLSGVTCLYRNNEVSEGMDEATRY